MNALHNILLASFLFIVTFSIASSFVYPTTKVAVVPIQTTTQLLMLTPSILEPITFTPKEILVPEEITTSDHIDLLPPQHLEEPTVEQVEITSIPIQVDEITDVEVFQTIPLSTPLDEIPIEVKPNETIPTNLQIQDITESVQSIDDQKDVEDLINLLKKRDTLKLFSPLQIKRQVNKVEKNLATTKAEILTLYKENPTEVISVLKTHLPELFV